MKYTRLGTTGLEVSRLAMGTMPFGGDADAAESARLYAAARDAGVNVFDSANVYAMGESERILGDLVRAHRDEVVISTKAFFPTGAATTSKGLSRYHLVRSVEESLRRLNTDRIDVFYLHHVDPTTPFEEIHRGLEQLVRSGKVLYPALSNWSAWQTARMLGKAEQHGWTPVAAIQPMYNLVKRQAEVELLPLAAHEGLAVFPYSPLAAGLLSGKYRAGTSVNGRVADNPMYRLRYSDPNYFEVATRFVALADELGYHPVTLAVAWVGAHPAVTAPLIAGRNVAQLQPALAAAEVVLDSEVRARIAALSPAPAPANDRNDDASEHDYGRR